MVDSIVVVAAAFNIGFGLFHLLFRKLFGWERDLPHLRPVNRAIVPGAY